MYIHRRIKKFNENNFLCYYYVSNSHNRLAHQTHKCFEISKLTIWELNHILLLILSFSIAFWLLLQLIWKVLMFSLIVKVRSKTLVFSTISEVERLEKFYHSVTVFNIVDCHLWFYIKFCSFVFLGILQQCLNQMI